MTANPFVGIDWGMIGTLVGIASLFVAGISGSAATARRRITWELTARTALADGHAAVGDRLTVHYDGKPVKWPEVAFLRLSYRGNRHLPSDAFDVPLRIVVKSQGAVILDGGVTETVPENLTAMVDVASDRITIRPLLLNPGDCLVVRIVTAGARRPEYAVEGRVADVPAIMREKRRGALSTGAAVGIAAAVMVVGGAFIFGPPGWTQALSTYLLTPALLAVMFVFMVQTMRGRLKHR